MPDAETVRTATRKAGIEMRITRSAGGFVVSVGDLSLDTKLETQDQGIRTIRELVESDESGKIRCQTPDRDSISFAAFYATGRDDKPFVHDVGTNTTHWLRDEDEKEWKLISAHNIVKRVLEVVKEDPGAPFEPEAVQALSTIHDRAPADYQRYRHKLKQQNKAVSMGAIDKAVRKQKADESISETHYTYARALIQQLTIDGHGPVGSAGNLYVFEPSSGTWIPLSVEQLAPDVANAHDGLENCRRNSDYLGVANLAMSLAANKDFFSDAPVGMACPDGFYRIDGDEVIVEPLTAKHRQRVKNPISPTAQPKPLFEKFLHETFASSTPNEEEEQRRLLQEIVGAIVLGTLHQHQKAVKFYDPFGRAGKGTLERCIRALVPPDFVTAISPFGWNREYYLASLAGSRLNVVGELPENESIPAAAFKTVTGGDPLTGRHPNHRTFTFKNEAAHLFMTNHLINTRDHSEAFYTRWIILEFPNSRLRSGLPINPELADRIIEQELPGIAQWALDGAKRLLKQGQFSHSSVHERLMAKWRRTANSLEEFIHECCETGGEDFKIRRAEFYREYKDWSKDNGRRPFAKGKVLELLDHNIGLGIRHAKLDGYEIFRGVRFRSDSTPPMDALSV